jgi:hypothetical protein
MAVVPDDDRGGISEEDDQQPPSSLTPPTQPVHAQHSPSPPRPLRLDLPFLPADRSDFDVHGALEDDKVREYVILSTLNCPFMLKHIISIIRFKYITRLILIITIRNIASVRIISHVSVVVSNVILAYQSALYLCGWLTVVRVLMEAVTIQSQTWTQSAEIDF